MSFAYFINSVPSPVIKSSEEGSSLSKSHWARMIKKVFEIDPLECPNCHQAMRIISCIDQGNVIYKILAHLGLLGKDYGSGENPEQSARAPP